MLLVPLILLNFSISREIAKKNEEGNMDETGASSLPEGDGQLHADTAQASSPQAAQDQCEHDSYPLQDKAHAPETSPRAPSTCLQDDVESLPKPSENQAQQSSMPDLGFDEDLDPSALRPGLPSPSSDKPTTNSGHDSGCAPACIPSSGLLEKLRSQMIAGFQRRNEQFVQKIFKKHETPDSGISRPNLSAALSDLGMCMSAGEVDELFYTLDLNSDGWISLSEFLAMIARVGKVEEWASTLPLASLLADCMPSKNEADPVRALSNLHSTEVQAVVACFSEGLVQLLGEEVEKLKRAYEDMQRKLEAAASQDDGDAAPKFALNVMSYGDIDDFFKGLSGRIGDPFLDFEKAMEAEHCHGEDSKTFFTTTNYKIRTCAYDEWQIVVHCDTSIPRPADMRHRRRIPKIPELIELVNQPETAAAKLSRAEVIAVVMYTGPMYEKYNCVLRRWPKEAYEDMKSKGATFTTTIHVLVSAVHKLAAVIKLSDGLKLYRGLGGVADLPESFFKPHANGGRGFTEWGFMSTTSDKQVAAYYSSMGSRGAAHVSPPMVLELTVSAVNRGACIKVCLYIYIYYMYIFVKQCVFTYTHTQCVHS
jgi:hypothetical protein